MIDFNLEDITRVDQPPRGGDCAGYNPHMWYAHTPITDETGKSQVVKNANELTQLAKSICQSCPVMRECLSYALYHESYGVWGGHSERERMAIRRYLNIKMIPREPINELLPDMARLHSQ